jgi:hypothetical protein
MFVQKTTFHDAIDYMMLFVNQWQKSSAPPLLIGEYSTLKFMRVMVNMDDTCRQGLCGCDIARLIGLAG